MVVQHQGVEFEVLPVGQKPWRASDLAARVAEIEHDNPQLAEAIRQMIEAVDQAKYDEDNERD